MVIEAPALGDKDYFAAAASQAGGTALISHGSTLGNIVTIGMPNINLGAPTYSDSDGVLMLNLPFMPNPVSGNDAVYVVCS